MLRASGFFTLVMGLIMLAVWIILLSTGQVRELRDTPTQGTFLLIVEFLTAALMIFSGIGVLLSTWWAKASILAALGMMLYTSINSIGVFAQEGVLPAAIFFSGLSIATLFFLLNLIFTRQAAGTRRSGSRA